LYVAIIHITIYSEITYIDIISDRDRTFATYRRSVADVSPVPIATFPVEFTDSLDGIGPEMNLSGIRYEH
jgi:hypothetical protein